MLLKELNYLNTSYVKVQLKMAHHKNHHNI